VTAYIALFWTAFGAATILPFYSEILFLALLDQGLDPAGLWLAATTGNTLGAVINWLIGLYLTDYAQHRWFPFKEHQLHHAQRWFQRFGSWTLLFAWLPVGGDALTFVAGAMRVRFLLFVVLVGIGKGARYWVLMWGTSGWWQASG
jgi:membrane protein YqaA with SNARE-associated domain